MTRGRKKDLSIPPSRSLVQQRDYRARKAHYIAELEERCRKAEEENLQLRKDLELAHANIATPCLVNPLASQVSAELLHNISLASASLVKFQRLAQQEHMFPASSTASSGIQASSNGILHPASFPSSPPPSAQPSENVHDTAAFRGRKRLCREDSPPSSESFRDSVSNSRSGSQRQRSTSFGSDCCGGILDCTDLCN